MRNGMSELKEKNKTKCVQVPEKCVGKSMQIIKEKPKRPINYYFPSNRSSFNHVNLNEVVIFSLFCDRCRSMWWHLLEFLKFEY